MKTAFLFLLLATLSTSCNTLWDDEDKAAFKQSCIDDAKTWAGSDDKAKAYCDCVMEKVMQKFPNEKDFLAHVGSVAKDPDIRQCKAEILMKGAAQ